MISSQYLSELRLQRDKIDDANRYPYNLPLLRNFDRVALHPEVTFLVGENGSGKSTLLEAIAISLGFNAEGGSKNFNFSTRASHSDLHTCLRVAKGWRRPRDGFFLRAESFFNVATAIEELDAGPGGAGLSAAYGGRSLHEQSHGESFLALLTERFRGQGLYLLDEPEAALSPQRQLAVLSRMHDLIADQSQFIIATHSPILLAYPGALILQCSENGIEPVAYEETEHFLVTRDFLVDPQRMLKVLLER
ncbi:MULTISPECIES: AAA family ATPase [unclassified Undibacterium]|uniref:AAA family ATPase n=1 Tax=unclassified Undibacterium TaxID=2630295 RepID=UPI002AC8CBE6|nr:MULTISPECIES: AAA family ATPase [unclassified Undibacterium]MEB0140645.1 AAA family ATPase [Undibacterium sp. CCC2.1]MEB0173674.1 AAA family ATPase [Undibacterium sp. CCC1.1]MEB0177658.1 AAA family ATPase [Undibacterium sp. CCC3.4]MEB0216825.1 AAA family ATPase [Undibacterium sp. 5I2]WPX41930.1 AAA family ATPase [Undibacterium sp. CCC3.4]